MSAPTQPHYLDELPGRRRTMDQDFRCERISTVTTFILAIPLGIVAWALLTEGDTLHQVYGLMVACSTIGYVILALIRERTVLPAPSATRRRKKSAVRM